jgi:hypothetical protein
VRKSVAKLCENSGHQRFVDITKGFKKIWDRKKIWLQRKVELTTPYGKTYF